MQQEKGKLTVFGATLLSLMGKRGIRSWTELSRCLSEQGFDYKPPRISNWAYGRHAVDKEFGQALLEVLDLEPKDRERLLDALFYGQSEYLEEHPNIPALAS